MVHVLSASIGELADWSVNTLSALKPQIFIPYPYVHVCTCHVGT